MSQLVTECPRCGSSKITFDLLDANQIGVEYGWKMWCEAFCICRHCSLSTVFVLSQLMNGSASAIDVKVLPTLRETINDHMKVESFVCIKDFAKRDAPGHLPKEIEAAFDEGATCLAVNCFNAAATMFRLCIDHATRSLLPERDESGLNGSVRRNLGARLKWLFDNHKLPENLRELSSCIREDGNDGAHAGTLRKEDAEDVADFTFELLERLYTEPERLRLAQERRAERRIKKE